MNRFCIKITGQSGSGLLSTGEIIINAFKDLGFFVIADREYPSLIKGGHSCFMINISDKQIHGLSKQADIMLSLDQQSMAPYFDNLKKQGVWVHGHERILGIKDLIKKAKNKNIFVISSQARTIAEKQGGNVLMTNVVLIGMFWKTLGLDFEIIKKSIKRKFAKKENLLKINVACLKAGFDSVEKTLELKNFGVKIPTKKIKTISMNGNKALALGAIHCGCRFYTAYPMSPASSILTYFADFSEKTGALVKQAEDEITVANMAFGAMYTGTRAFCATSGGGYDLMTETVSLAGMTETPFVCVIAQRPGPATGLPTWSSQGDLNLAIYSSHGEFSRIVIGVSDPEDSFELIQHAFNLAEKYQTVVLILTEKTIAETEKTIFAFNQKQIPIERGLVKEKDFSNLKSEDRYEITKNGLSKRWLPCTKNTPHYFGQGDEHKPDGSLDESEKSEEMYAKRMKKQELISKALPEPEIHGTKSKADISFIGWGSTKNSMLDIMGNYKKKGIKINYLHFSYLYPLKTKKLAKFFKENSNVNLIEGNYQGQLGNLIKQNLNIEFKNKLLKYNGRPFFIEDIENFINKKLKKSDKN